MAFLPALMAGMAAGTGAGAGAAGAAGTGLGAEMGASSLGSALSTASQIGGLASMMSPPHASLPGMSSADSQMIPRRKVRMF